MLITDSSTNRLVADDGRIAAALSDDYGRRILAACIHQPRSVKDIEHATGLPPATLYRHVSRLLEHGLLVVERSALTGDGKRYDLYRSAVRRAQIEFDESGVRCTWEPMEGLGQKLARVWAGLRRA